MVVQQQMLSVDFVHDAIPKMSTFDEQDERSESQTVVVESVEC